MHFYLTWAKERSHIRVASHEAKVRERADFKVKAGQLGDLEKTGRLD